MSTSHLGPAASSLLCAALALITALPAFSAESRRQIEEVIVTAERKESSVQDTSISITAFTSEMMDDFGVRNQSDLQNFVPATTIQPYDASVRGVGRNFRNLGGDPGVATYMNGVYSEDLYTATIGSMWDVDRVEVLRGPQGTLYGRNAVGGAINFIYKRPTDRFEADFKAIAGNFDTRDVYGAVSGPLVDGILNSRLTFSNRKHDGYFEEKGFGPDSDSGDERNIALQLEWRPASNVTVNLRSNQADVDRVMGGANGAGLITLAGEDRTDLSRDFDNAVHGFRAVDPAQQNPLARDFVSPGDPILNFINPATGNMVQGQHVRAGVDTTNADGLPNYGYGANYSDTACVVSDRDNIDGDDACVVTNGFNNETFDQQGNQLEVTWDVSDAVSLKYIFGLNDLLYERTTDDDSTASTTLDRQFYVNHEAEYKSHELQLFWNSGTGKSLTSGIFFYDSNIDQRGDFFSSTRQPQFNDPALDNILATVAPGAFPGNPPLTFFLGTESVGLYTAKNNALADGTFEKDSVLVATGPWMGDSTLDGVKHGPDSPATDLLYRTNTERDAFAAYTQGVWDINEKFTLTAGIRYARDDVEGEENLGRYTETPAILGLLGMSLGEANILRGALDPATLEPTDNTYLWTAGVPFSLSVHRSLDRVDEEMTWRLNLDYHIDSNNMVYGNVTTGYRSGGFNLVYFSTTAEYDPEELTAYEIGYKGQLLNNTLQFNASTYYYDYETIHTFGTEASLIGGEAATTTSVLEAPGAEIFGVEAEMMWLATDRLTLGGNLSYTPSEYNESLPIVDGADPRFPNGVIPDLDRRIDIKGNQLLHVPEHKGTIWARYGIPLGDSGNVELLGTFSFIDDVYYSQYETELDKAPAYERLDMRATWTSPTRAWKVSAFVNNVMDELGIRQIMKHGEAEGFRRTAQLTEPRVYGLELSYSMY